MRRLSVVLFTALATAFAQNPPLTPTSNTVLDTTATQGHFAFSHIDIPVGVRVTFSGAFPVQIECDGDAIIRGQLDVDASGSTSGPGFVLVGQGSSGIQVLPGTAFGCPSPSFGGRGTNTYGSVIPFDLRGGSPGGDVDVWGAAFGTLFCFHQYSIPGGGAGGTLVLNAGGRLDVHGTVAANGSYGASVWTGSGSGGTLLLRGAGGLTVHSSGSVTAIGGVLPGPFNATPGGPGVVRLDAYAAAPSILGTVTPPPFLLELPNLFETAAPVIGNTWELRVAAPRGDGVFLAASFQPGSFTNAYGTVGIDIFTAITFAVLVMPATGHDPLAYYQLPVPNVPGLIGITLWTAGLDWYTALPPRYTNTIVSSIQ